VIGLVGALQFLTRVPIRTGRAIAPAEYVPWLPIAGALIGAAVGGIAAGMMELVPPAVAAAVAVLAGVLITGAFHEDGLADTADAIAGGSTPARRLAILDDPRHGTYGVAALCGSIVVRVVSVAALGPAAAFAGLLSAHSLGRAAATVTIVTQPTATRHGLGADAAHHVPRARALAGATAGLGIAGAAIGPWVLVVAPLVAAATAAIVIVARRAFGGVTGDVLGAIEQVGEIAVLVTTTALAIRHDLWWR